MKIIFMFILFVTMLSALGQCSSGRAAELVYLGDGRYGCKGSNCAVIRLDQARQDEATRVRREDRDAERVREDKRIRQANDKSAVK